MRSSRLRARIVAALIAMLVASFGGGGTAAQQVGEYRLKAALVYNFAKFVEWPQGTFTDAGAPFTVCVLGRDPFGTELEEIVHGHHLKGQPTAVRRVVDVTPICRVLFIADSEFKRLPSIIDHVRDLSILTISDGDNFLEQGGIVRLVNRDEQVRFEVNLTAAERAHLKISARVLELATSARHFKGP